MDTVRMDGSSYGVERAVPMSYDQYNSSYNYSDHGRPPPHPGAMSSQTHYAPSSEWSTSTPHRTYIDQVGNEFAQ